MSPPLAFDSVFFRYGRGRPVVESFTHEFKPGMVTWLRGPNGSGKTTLLRLGAGLLTPRMGTVVASARPSYVASSMAFHEQLTLSEELLYLRSLSNVDTAELDAGLEEWSISGLDQTMTMDELSTGWRQRLALCLASVSRRDVVLLDEPFANLDDDASHVLRQWMARVTLRGGIVVVAHHGEATRLGEVDLDVVQL